MEWGVSTQHPPGEPPKMITPNCRIRRLLMVFGTSALLFSAVATADQASSGTVTEEERFFEAKCGECHPSERIFLVELTPEQRRHVVLRMRERLEAGEAWLSDEEVEKLLGYVDERRKAGEAVKPESIASSKQLFRERCKGCHELDRIYAQVKTERENPTAWLHVVTRMQGKAPGWISEQEAKQIIDYLRSRTRPRK